MITVVGLGPGDPQLLTLRAQAVPSTPTKFDPRGIGDGVKGGGAVNVAPPRTQTTVRTIIPRLKEAGGQGIVEYPLNKIIL